MKPPTTLYRTTRAQFVPGELSLPDPVKPKDGPPDTYWTLLHASVVPPVTCPLQNPTGELQCGVLAPGQLIWTWLGISSEELAKPLGNGPELMVPTRLRDPKAN